RTEVLQHGGASLFCSAIQQFSTRRSSCVATVKQPIASEQPCIYLCARRDHRGREMNVLRRFGLFALAAALSLAGCGLNSVPTADEQGNAAWGNLQADYQRRSDLIPT